MSQSADVMEKIVALCRRRGFIFGSSEIYGGIGGFWDYGPLGCELKRNIKDAWWEDMVRNPPPGPGGREFQMVGVDCSIIMNPKVWEASGHVGGFSDPMVDDKETKQRFRADQFYGLFAGIVRKAIVDLVSPLPRAHASVIASSPVEAASELAENKQLRKLFGIKSFETTSVQHGYVEADVDVGDGQGSRGFSIARVEIGSFAGRYHTIPSPFTGKTGSLTEPREFNLMFQTHVGALQDAASVAYLRPETAQGIFANFKNVMDSTRVKIPFGIAQLGKAFRNEINPRNYTFRSREFEQMEIEFFCKPDESMMWYEFWRDARINWYTSLGIKSDKLRPRQQGKEELAHYSSACTDIEYLFPFSDEPQELEGVAHRGSYDLNQHGKFARNDENAFAVIDEDAPLAPGEKRDKYVPHVIEPSAGADRFTLAVICEAYCYDESRASPEFMKFHPRLAPIKAAVFPLVAKDGLPEIAEPIFREIKKHFPCQYDAKQSIGKRYARMDEAGTPFCFTIDGQTKEDGTVTVRNRDDASQIRIDKSQCLKYLRDHLGL
ncbi:MAG: glycine--tRNA ligase [Phycisphaerales bacterium]|nr:glycine--tRNA ligase [Phycisphaerales bacterium]